MTEQDPLLTVEQSAARAGVTAATWRGYVSQRKGHPRYGPAPDDPAETH